MPLQGAGQTHGSNIYLIGGHASRDVENLQSWANTWSCPHNNNFQSASAQSPRCRKGFEALFCFHLSSSLFIAIQSYTIFSDTRHGKGCFSTLFRKRWQKHRAAFLFSKARPRKISGCKASLLCMHEIVGIRLTLPYYESYASSCTPFTARPLGSFMFLKAASHARASAVEHATLGTLGTLRAALSLGKCSWKMLR